MCKKGHKFLAEHISFNLFNEARENGFTWEILSKHTGLAPRTLSEYAGGYGKIPSLPVFMGVLDLVKPHKTLQIIAEHCNCIAVRLPNIEPDITNFTQAASDIMKETADVLGEIADSLKDGKIDNREKLRILDEVNEAIEALIKLKMMVEK